jgi:hypothetical protein
MMAIALWVKVVERSGRRGGETILALASLESMLRVKPLQKGNQ